MKQELAERQNFGDRNWSNRTCRPPHLVGAIMPTER